jgi:hypothetical protein
MSTALPSSATHQPERVSAAKTTPMPPESAAGSLRMQIISRRRQITAAGWSRRSVRAHRRIAPSEGRVLVSERAGRRRPGRAGRRRRPARLSLWGLRTCLTDRHHQVLDDLRP